MAGFHFNFTLAITFRAARCASRKLKAKLMLKLNLGCGLRRLEGYVNVDQAARSAADLLFDLETFPWPWGDASVGEIKLTHSLEHMGARGDVFFGIVKELYRVLAPEGRVEIAVPHPFCSAFVNDPTHVRAITPEILSLFSKKNCARFAEQNWPNTPLALYLDVDFDLLRVENKLTPYWAERYRSGALTQADLDFACATYLNVVEEVTMLMVKVPAGRSPACVI